MKLFSTLILMAVCLTAIGQTSPTKGKSWFRVDSSFTKDGKRQKPQTDYSYVYIDTEFKYTDSSGKSVIIQNSLPKGGGDSDRKSRYTDSTGKKYRYAVFWTRVINETATPFELNVSFPAILPSPYSYSKLFVPRDTMTVDKESWFGYGIRGLKFFFDADFNTTKLKRTINPGEECSFYVVFLSPAYSPGGIVRTGLVLKGRDLFYKVNIIPTFDPALFSCGQIVFKKLRQ